METSEAELIEAIEQPPPRSRRKLIFRLVFLFLSLIVLYLLLPSLAEVWSTAPRLADAQPMWLIVVVVTQLLSFGCVWYVQKVVLRAKHWFPIITSQLVGNSFSRVVPGGAAAGAALQFRMLSIAGINAAKAITGLTAFGLIQTASLFALPILAMPAILSGAAINRGLERAAILGSFAFLIMLAVGIAATVFDRPLLRIGAVVQRFRNRWRRHSEPMTDLPEKLIEERNLVRKAIGQRRYSTPLAVAGRIGLDYLCLLAALAAVGSHPSPSLVLLAYTASAVLGMIPITPGGLGIVEAGLSGTLVLAGVSATDAVFATLIYRLASYWMPMFSGAPAWFVFRYRYRDRYTKTPPKAAATAE